MILSLVDVLLIGLVILAVNLATLLVTAYVVKAKLQPLIAGGGASVGASAVDGDRGSVEQWPSATAGVPAEQAEGAGADLDLEVEESE